MDIAIKYLLEMLTKFSKFSILNFADLKEEQLKLESAKGKLENC